ncbi:MAG: hypothetical protein WBN06_16580 [Lysobacterales bacterium]
MKNIQILLFVVLVSILISPALAKESREQKQARLDAACEVKRQKLLVPMRSEYIAECVTNKEKPSKEECERFYADYGERMGGRAPLYYDLPECVEAFEFQQSARDPGS